MQYTTGAQAKLDAQLNQAKNTKLDIDAMLNEVSYSAIDNYRPTEFALRVINRIKLIHAPDGTENLSPPVHFKVLDNLVTKHKYVANMMHRGFGKSTLMTYLIFELAIEGHLPNFGVVDFIMYVSDSMDNGIATMRANIDYMYDNSPYLQEMLPFKKTTEAKWIFENKLGHRLVIKGYGAKSGIRGTREKNKRPQLAIIDDILGDDDASSPTIVQKIKDTISKAIDFALHPKHRKVFWLGTPFHAGDPLYEAVESGQYKVNLYPVCEKFPCTREEFRGSWEDRFDYDSVLEQYTKSLGTGEISSFNQELMLRIMSEEDRLIHDGDIRKYNRNMLLKGGGIDRFNIYITTDWATTAKESADYSFISVWAVNHNQDYFWLDGMCARQTIDESFEWLFKFVHKYSPLSVGLEVTGQQEGLVTYLQREMQRRQIYFNLASQGNSNRPGIRPNTNKLQRFHSVVPLFKAGKIYLPEDYKVTSLKELELELSLACVGGFKSKHDDALDTVSMLSLMPIFFPDEPSVFTSDDDGIYRLHDQDNDINYASSYVV